MGGFWDRRAEENPYYFIDSRVDYRSPDVDEFWAGGRSDLAALLGDVDVEVGSGDSVVEIGCGIGRLTRPIAAAARDVRALDVSERMLALAREHNPQLGNVEWLQGDGSSLTAVDDASADAVVSHVVFQHIPDPEITLSYVREIGRVLRPGGWAAFQVSTDPRVHRRRRGASAFVRRLLARMGRSPGGQDDPAWLGSAVPLERLRAVAEGAGMELERVVNPGSQWTMVLARRRASKPRRP